MDEQTERQYKQICLQIGLDGSAASLPSSSSSWLLVSDILLLDCGMEQPLMFLDVPNMALDDLGSEGNDSLVSHESRKMTKGMVLLELGWLPLHGVVALDQLLLVVAGVLAASMYGHGTRNGKVGQVPCTDLGPVNGGVDIDRFGHLGNILLVLLLGEDGVTIVP